MELYDLSRDVDRVAQGVWVENVKKGGDARFLVLGYTTAKIRQLAAEMEAARGDLSSDRDPVAFEKRTDWEARQKLKAGLLGFENVTLAGKAFAYDKAAVDAMLDDPRFEPFALVVSAAMNKADETRLQFEKEAEKNSSDGSVES